MNDILKYISEKEYNNYKKIIKDGESIKIYTDSKIDISIKKVKKKTYTIINEYGNKSLNQALNEICSLV